jgi:hypothetical protein
MVLLDRIELDLPLALIINFRGLENSSMLVYAIHTCQLHDGTWNRLFTLTSWWHALLELIA